MTASTNLVPITEENQEIYYNLSQAYEAEFSSISKKLPDARGLFKLDTDWKAPYRAYYWVENFSPVAFVNTGMIEGRFDIAEFYVIPTLRKHGLGKRLAFAMFDIARGPIQVRQIEGADAARSFWRQVIQEYTGGDYEEEEVEDPYWGPVTRQLFHSRS